MPHTMEMLREDHVNMLHILRILEQQCNSMKDGADPDLVLLSEIMSYCLNYPDLYHHPKEDLVYRRLIEKGVNPTEIGDLEAAHENLHGLVHRLGEVVREASKSGEINRKTLISLIDSLVQGYRLHIDTEEKLVFPEADKLLNSADWRQIDEELAATPDPIFRDRALPESQGFARTLIKRMEEIGEHRSGV